MHNPERRCYFHKSAHAIQFNHAIQYSISQSIQKGCKTMVRDVLANGMRTILDLCFFKIVIEKIQLMLQSTVQSIQYEREQS